MSGTSSGNPFMMASSNLLNPPGIEKILDTTLTKDNQRYYKVKWVKITWEAEDDVSYFSDIIENFWAQYAKECLLSSSDQEHDPIHKKQCNLNTVLSNVPKPEHQGNDALREEKNDLLSLTSPEIISSPCSSIEPHPSSGIISAHLTDCDLEMITYPYKNIQSAFPHEYDYSLEESHLPKSGQEPISSPLVEADTVPLDKQSLNPVSCKEAKMMEAKVVNSEKLSVDSETHIYKCSICEIEFDEQQKYLKHEKSHENQKCEICGKEFQRLGHLKVHMNSHNNIRPFSCQKCEMAFLDKSSLNKHMQVHSNERKFSCGECSMKFKRAQHLRRHIETHKQLKNFSCSICKKQFLQKSALKIHSNVHSGEKPFKCLQCAQAFGDRATLRRHTLTHAKVKPLKCEKCEKRFCRQSSLKIHKKTKHGDTESEKKSIDSNEQK